VDDLPEQLVVGGVTYSRVDADDSIACWTATVDVEGDGSARQVSLVIEPAAVPDSAVLELAADVSVRFGEFARVAADYLRDGLRDPRHGLDGVELGLLDAEEAPFGEPEAVVWADGTWMLRFAESRLDIADPFGIGVLFTGETPDAIEDLSEAEPA
jgi:hypothetical protein